MSFKQKGQDSGSALAFHFIELFRLNDTDFCGCSGFWQGIPTTTYCSGEPRIPVIFGQEQIHFAVLGKS